MKNFLKFMFGLLCIVAFVAADVWLTYSILQEL